MPSARKTADTFDLTDGATIEVGTASFKTVRGYTIVAALCDELAFWPTDDAADPDYEVINALRPGIATIPNAMLPCASSPYARRGALWDAHRRHHGKDGDPILVWHADTRTMNPTAAQRVIDEVAERDPAMAAAEYGAQFRSDVETFISRDAVEACVGDYREMAPASSCYYRAFVDPSGDCPAIDGIIEEAVDVAGEVDDSAVLDAALIAAAQAVEHYEITRYGSLIAWAQLLRRNDCASVLQQTLDEEKATDKKLTAMAESRLNRRAA